MRKPRDFDAELKALEDKAKDLKAKKVHQLGELVIAAGADSLSPDELAGALVAIAEIRDTAKREAWAKRGAAFFRGRTRSSGARQSASNDASNTNDPARSAPAPDRDHSSSSMHPVGPQPPSGNTGAA